MDDILKELKKLREESENRFNTLIERVEGENARLSEELDNYGRKVFREDAENGETGVFRHQVNILLQLCRDISSLHAACFREFATLHNARCAELARQLTVLPLERMDIILDKFERRIEDLECRLQRLEGTD
jgi:hypothetical protein